MKLRNMLDSVDNSLSLVINLFVVIIALCTLFVAVVSLIIAVKSIKVSQRQFEDNQEKAQELHQANMSQMESTNTIVLENFRALQETTNSQLENAEKQLEKTNKQLEITDKQLETTENLLFEQVLSGRPMILLDIRDGITVGSIQGEKRPFINIQLINKGNRNADKCGIHLFLVYSDFSHIVMRSVAPIKIEPTLALRTRFEPTIKSGNEKDFYLVTKVYYYDEKMNQTYTEVKQFQFNGNSLNELNIENDSLTTSTNEYLKSQGKKSLAEL